MLCGMVGGVLAVGRVWAEDIPEKTRQWNRFERCEWVAARGHDGDSFKVRMGGEERFLRLAFVDAPESDDRFPSRIAEQARHFGISTNEVLLVGKRATLATTKLLSRPFTVWTRWASAAGSTRLPRFYAFIELADGRDLNEVLLNLGHVRVKGTAMNTPKGERAKDYRARLLKLEVEARKKRVGIWARAVSGKGRGSVFQGSAERVPSGRPPR